MIAAVVPAAGMSTRMGRPKLVLEVGGQPLIARVVAALRGGGADAVVVVAPPPGQEGGPRLADLAREAGAIVEVLAAASPDMRATIERGLLVLARLDPSPIGVLIAPADSVGLYARLVAEVVARFRRDPSRIVVPERDGRRGHPLALPWREALAITALPPGVGVNALLEARSAIVDRLQVDAPGLDADLDTPEDYRRWVGGEA